MRYRVSFTIPHEYVSTIMEVMHGVGTDFHFDPVADGNQPLPAGMAPQQPVRAYTRSKPIKRTVNRTSRADEAMIAFLEQQQSRPFSAIEIANALSANGLSPGSTSPTLSKYVKAGTIVRNTDGTYQVPAAA